jgi:hypothetical protein
MICHILNVHGFSDVRQTQMHTAEPLVPEPTSFDVEIAIEQLKILGTGGPFPGCKAAGA